MIEKRRTTIWLSDFDRQRIEALGPKIGTRTLSKTIRRAIAMVSELEELKYETHESEDCGQSNMEAANQGTH